MENENKFSLSKYYLLGGVVLLIVIIVIVLLSKNSKPVQQNTQALNTANTTTNAPEVNPTSTNGFVGTWISSVQGKGIPGRESVTVNGIPVHDLPFDLRNIIRIGVSFKFSLRAADKTE